MLAPPKKIRVVESALTQVRRAFWVVQVVFFEQLRVFLALEPTKVPGDLALQALESFQYFYF